MIVSCQECGVERSVTPARAKTFKFCSYSCRGAWRAKHWTGEAHPRWQGGEREKTCLHCSEVFTQRPGQPITTFKRQKFCSKSCADIGGLRYFGPANNKWTGNALPRRDSKHAVWSKNVMSRDAGSCQSCGCTEGEMHAHHVKPWKAYPELRYDVANGLTVCAPCHWAIHSGPKANGVNSGEVSAGNAGDNPEPSFRGNLVEGVTTRGRACRRWNGNCTSCGATLSRRMSDVAGKAAVFCDLTCRGKWTSAFKKGQPRHQRYGGNASTSALRESGDIVWTYEETVRC